MTCYSFKRARRIGAATITSVGVSVVALAQTAAPAAPPPDVRLSPDGNGTLELPQIDVTGQRGTSGTAGIGPPPPPYAGGQVATGGRVGLLGNRSNADIPFTQNNYTEQLIRDQQDRRVNDVFDNDPGVRATESPFTYQPNVIIRGLQLNARDFAFDGLYGLVFFQRPEIEGIERVEVLNGPGALLYGFPPNGGGAGIVNLIPKRAGDTPLTRFTTEYESAGTGGTSFDVGRRYGADNAFGVRLNGAYREGDTPIKRDHERFGDIILGTDFRSDKLRVSVDLGYQRFNTTAEPQNFSVDPGFAIPRAPSLKSNAQNTWERVDGTQIFGATRAEYDIRPNLTVYATIGGSRLDFPQSSASPTILNARGDLSFDPVQGGTTKEDQWTAEAGVRAKVQLGPVTDTVTLGASHYNEFLLYRAYPGPSYSSNLYGPAVVSRPTFPVTNPRLVQVYEHLDGVALVNTFSVLDDRIQLLAGGRFQVAEQNDSNGTSRTSYTSKVAGTPLTALIIKPLQEVSVYASYAEGFGFGPTAPSNAVNAAQSFPPVVTQQVETGIKLDFGRIGGSFALFQNTLPSGFTNPTTRIFGLNGEQRDRGIDFTVFGSPVAGVRVLGGVTLLDAKLTQTSGGTLNGRIVPGGAAVQTNVGGEYDLPWVRGLTVSARVINTSRQYYDQQNTQSIPAWTRLDLGARYSFNWVNGTPLTARFNVQNALATRYWSSTGQGSLALGTPQTFRFSLSADL